MTPTLKMSERASTAWPRTCSGNMYIYVHLLDDQHLLAGGDDLLQGFPFQELHGNERNPVGFADIIDGDDVGVAKLASRLRLAVEPLEKLWIASHRG
jgi:endo-1,4-beta-mannosidase